MSEHYFSENPQSESKPKTWNYQLKGHSYTFTSDIGVFSKNEVDFGTQLLIDTFKEPNVRGDILDMGCGYGPIGITLADSLPERKVIMADVNARALMLAKGNARHNNVNNVEVVESNSFEGLSGRSFAAILTNPPIRAGKNIVHQIFEEGKDALLNQGELWIVIQKKQGAPSAKEKLMTLFSNVEVVARKKGYHILRAVK